MPAGRTRKLTRVQIALMRRKPRKHERFILSYEFPAHISGRVRKRLDAVTKPEWPLVERGLREWFICCAWRGGAVLGMPSRAVDEAWHEFILDSIAYIRFCEEAFGGYLHHTPDEAMSTPMGNALVQTVRAWDRSETGQEEESVLWNLDEQLGIERPLGIDGLGLAAVRSRTPDPTAVGVMGVGYVAPCFVGAGSGEAGGGGCSGGGGGEGGGGGCGGGGGGN
jgi:uncharacterized membrane protein YgcG